jgi:hypothetical protein
VVHPLIGVPWRESPEWRSLDRVPCLGYHNGVRRVGSAYRVPRSGSHGECHQEAVPWRWSTEGWPLVGSTEVGHMRGSLKWVLWRGSPGGVPWRGFTERGPLGVPWRVFSGGVSWINVSPSGVPCCWSLGEYPLEGVPWRGPLKVVPWRGSPVGYR